MSELDQRAQVLDQRAQVLDQRAQVLDQRAQVLDQRAQVLDQRLVRREQLRPLKGSRSSAVKSRDVV